MRYTCTAAALGYQQRLGTPIAHLVGVPVYRPWQLFEWWYFYDAYALTSSAVDFTVARALLPAQMTYSFVPKSILSKSGDQERVHPCLPPGRFRPDRLRVRGRPALEPSGAVRRQAHRGRLR